MARSEITVHVKGAPVAKQAFSPGLDAGVTKYLDEHHIVANDVSSYAIERPADGGVILTLRCFVHESFFADLKPQATEPPADPTQREEVQ